MTFAYYFAAALGAPDVVILASSIGKALWVLHRSGERVMSETPIRTVFISTLLPTWECGKRSQAAA